MRLSVQHDATEERSKKSLISPVLRIALLVGIAVHLAGFLIFRVVSNPLPSIESRTAFIEYVSMDSLASDASLEEQAELFDSAPLFIPTKWNAAQQIQFMHQDRLRERFPEFEPEMNLSAALKPDNLILEDALNIENPQSLLDSRFWRFFTDFGTDASEEIAFQDADLYAEVMPQESEAARVFIAQKDLTVPDELRGGQVAVFYLRTQGSGRLIGLPVLSQSSGSAAFDQAAAEWLTTASVLRQMPVGYLTVTVFP